MTKNILHELWLNLTVKTVLLNLAILLIYIFSGRVGLSFAFTNPSATPIWLPTGIALAAVLFYGYRVIPGIFLGAFVVNNLTAGTAATSFFIALGNTGEAAVGAYLVKRFAHGIHVFENGVDIFKYTLFAAVLSTMISATIGVTTLIIGDLASLDSFWPIWLTWWLGDMGGALILAPFLLVWASLPRLRTSYRQVVHVIVSFLILFVVTQIVFRGIIPYPYISIPIAVWIAFWFGQRGATVATLFVALFAIFHTLNNRGPFADQESLNQSLLLVQMFLGMFSLTGLIFAATVSALKKGEKTLASHEERFRALIENGFDAVVLIEANSKIIYASPSVTRLLGYTPEELQGMTGFDLVLPEDRMRTMRTLAQLVLKPGGTVTIEYRTIRKDKKIIWVEATGTNLLLEENVNAVVVNFHDITEKKISQETLTHEKLQDEAMLSSIGEGIIATDNTGKITMVNQAACDILGWKEKDLVGNSLVETIPMQDASGKTLEASERPMTNVLSLGREIVTSLTNYYVKKDKTKVPVRVTVTPIILDEKIVGTIETFYDITREKEVDRAKTEFVSIASHQLRTPLATLNWYLEKLIKGTRLDKKKQDDYFGEVYQASQRMIRLINALLNASRLELGTFMVEPKKVQLEDIVNEEIQDLEVQIKQKQIHIKKQVQEKLPPFAADPKLLSIVIQNLLSNAIKYSKKTGTVTIHVTHSKKEFVIQVSDNGFGIPKPQQAKIFTKMFRADNARSIDPEGSGLGLYIVKSIIDATGGTISFVSNENKGTTFSVSFPEPGMHKKEGQKQLR